MTLRLGCLGSCLRSYLMLFALCTGLGCSDGNNAPMLMDAGAGGCKVDDDCIGEMTKRACRGGKCTDPGCPSGSTYIGSGTFNMGCNPIDGNCPTNAQPIHQVAITQSYCISKKEMTVGQYRACLKAGTCQMPTDMPGLRCTTNLGTWTDTAGANEEQPLNCILWDEAVVACSFLGGRLPTEAEWEKAARGRDNRPFPWGLIPPQTCDEGVNWGGPACSNKPWDTAAAVATKGEMAVSQAQAADMAGNLWEWTADYWSDMTYKTCTQNCTDPKGPASGLLRVRRGGSFQSTSTSELRTYYREFHLVPRSDTIGVRCVMPAP